jgi:hypothetical protein
VKVPWKGLPEGSSGGFPLGGYRGDGPQEGVNCTISPTGGPLEGFPSRGSTELGPLAVVPGWAVGMWVPGAGLQELVSWGVPWNGSLGGVPWSVPRGGYAL